MFYNFIFENVPLQVYIDTYEYFVYGRETCPETTLVHFQDFVSFKVRTKFSTVLNRLPNAHIEKMRGTIQEAAENCKNKRRQFSRIWFINNSY